MIELISSSCAEEDDMDKMKYETIVQNVQTFIMGLPYSLRLKLLYVLCVSFYILIVKNVFPVDFYDGILLGIGSGHLFHVLDYVQPIPPKKCASVDTSTEADTTTHETTRTSNSETVYEYKALHGHTLSMDVVDVPEEKASTSLTPSSKGLIFHLPGTDTECGVKVSTQDGRSYCWKYGSSRELSLIANSSDSRIIHDNMYKAILEIVLGEDKDVLVFRQQVNPWDLSPNELDWIPDFQVLE